MKALKSPTSPEVAKNWVGLFNALQGKSKACEHAVIRLPNGKSVDGAILDKVKIYSKGSPISQRVDDVTTSAMMYRDHYAYLIDKLIKVLPC